MATLKQRTFDEIFHPIFEDDSQLKAPFRIDSKFHKDGLIFTNGPKQILV